MHWRTSPDLPGCVSVRVHFLQHLLLAVGVHALPKPAMNKGMHPAGSCHLNHWLLFQNRSVVLEVIPNPFTEHEESPANVLIGGFGLFTERSDSSLVEREVAKTSGQSNRSDSGQST